MISIRTIVAAAATLACSASLTQANDTGFATSHDWRREGGRVCFLDHTHGGTATAGTKGVAFNSALHIWYMTTADEYGTDWAKWDKSASKSVIYTRDGELWTAKVESRPCK